MKVYVDELPIKVFQRVIHFDDGKLNCVELGFSEKYEPQSIELIADHDKEKDHRIAVLERALKKACKQLSEVYGDCPYDSMDLPMPNYCEKECEKHEELLCWDVYLTDQAEKELKEK